jgi:sialate O-acetylesterase
MPLHNLMSRLAQIACLAFIGLAASVCADVRLPSLLSDGVVLQRDTSAAVWGWADDGEAVRVSLDGVLVGTAPVRDGRWQLQLPPRAAGGPHTLGFEGANRIVVKDVWFGDVWVASGQSNMELPMRRVRERYADDVAAADLPLVRQFKVPKTFDFDRPHEDIDKAGWVASTPESVLEFSAVAWFFARALNARFGVPIGIINSSYGGSTVEGWMSEQALEPWPKYLDVARRYREDGYLEGLIGADKAESDAWYGKLDAADQGLQSDPPWWSTDLDVSAWNRMQVPGYWADSGAGGVNGVFWFRTSVDLPESAAAQPAMLRLGRIVDADTVWVNGVQVGNTTYQYPPRRYELPAGVLRAGRNTIAVRVVNTAGKGGFVPDKPYQLEVGGDTFDLRGEWSWRLGAESIPLAPPRFQDYMQPLGIYNAMLAPLQKMTIKGVIWYQGESNVGRADEYRKTFPAMIRSWRSEWAEGDFPFLFVQLASFLEAREQPVESATAELRQAQAAALDEPNTAMAVAIDVGEWNDIHPENKQAVGERLMLAARRLAYGEEDVVYSGPTLRAVDAHSGRLVLHFEHVGSGLEARGGPLEGFAVAGADGHFEWAKAEIDGDRVTVWSEAVPDPVRVRYAWADNPVNANLYNREGLPAAPFEAAAHSP